MVCSTVLSSLDKNGFSHFDSHFEIETRECSKRNVCFLDSINIDTFNYRKMSKLQQYMLSICEEIFGKDYELEKTFDWLRNPKTNHKLFIDIYYKKLNLAIEVDGSQHYQKYKWRYPLFYQLNNYYLVLIVVNHM